MTDPSGGAGPPSAPGDASARLASSLASAWEGAPSVCASSKVASTSARVHHVAASGSGVAPHALGLPGKHPTTPHSELREAAASLEAASGCGGDGASLLSGPGATQL
jgi:hypothetical protein